MHTVYEFDYSENKNIRSNAKEVHLAGEKHESTREDCLTRGDIFDTGARENRLQRGEQSPRWTRLLRAPAYFCPLHYRLQK